MRWLPGKNQSCACVTIRDSGWCRASGELPSLQYQLGAHSRCAWRDREKKLYAKGQKGVLILGKLKRRRLNRDTLAPGCLGVWGEGPMGNTINRPALVKLSPLHHHFWPPAGKASGHKQGA